MEPLDSLSAVQRRLWQLITDPEGVEAALLAGGDRAGAGLARLLRSDRELPASERLAVYANAYFVRIHDCLREDFGALATVLGATAFHDLVKTYLMIHPPTRASLRHAGAQLARHLRTEPFASIFGGRCAYAADLAELEWALSEAFYAPDAPAIGKEVLAEVAPEAWADLRFELTPTLHVVACDWPVQRVRERFDADAAALGEDGGSLAAERTQLRVWRRDERTLYRAMPPLEAAALAVVAAGETFGALCEEVALHVAESEAAQASASLLAAWLTAGLVVGLRTAGPDVGGSGAASRP